MDRPGACPEIRKRGAQNLKAFFFFFAFQFFRGGGAQHYPITDIQADFEISRPVR